MENFSRSYFLLSLSLSAAMERLLLFGIWSLLVIIGHDLIESTNFRTVEEGGIDGGNCNDKVLPRTKIVDSSIIFIIYSLCIHMVCRILSLVDFRLENMHANRSLKTKLFPSIPLNVHKQNRFFFGLPSVL